jgi:uncharacterized protein (TIGR04255 family)
MAEIKLRKAPLLEGILEIRWKLEQQPNGPLVDPNYKILVGRLFDRIESKYPIHEALPTASMPDEMLAHLVQHRFRIEKDEWPLIQLGPGIVTLNNSDKYDWPDFKIRGIELVKTLFDAYPNSKNNLVITNLILKYIDAIPFDFEKNDILEFITNNLGVNMRFPDKFFNSSPIQRNPAGLNTGFSFPIIIPNGNINLHFVSGKMEEKDILIWETIVQTDELNMVKMPEKFEDWFSSAHELTHKIFFKMIEGKLEESFR